MQFYTSHFCKGFFILSMSYFPQFRPHFTTEVEFSSAVFPGTECNAVLKL